MSGPVDLPPADDLGALGLVHGEGWELLSRRHGHRIYRVRQGGRTMILKWLGDSPQRTEVCAYTLLERLGVPTPRVHARLPHALLLEDLDADPRWRLAREVDANEPAVGCAVAAWYEALHAAGDRLRVGVGFPDFLRRESDALTPVSVLAIGHRLGLADLAVMQRAAETIPDLVAAQRALPETLNYNDFHWTNLALTRSGIPPKALVFDYGLLGVGPRYSDLRNVASSLGSRAADAFLAVSGPVDPHQVLLDAPLATLYALHIATTRAHLPGWAARLVAQVQDGTLAKQLDRAIAAIC